MSQQKLSGFGEFASGQETLLHSLFLRPEMVGSLASFGGRRWKFEDKESNHVQNVETDAGRDRCFDSWRFGSSGSSTSRRRSPNWSWGIRAIHRG